MGVPSFYRWLTKKYPNIAVNAAEEEEEEQKPITSLENPNGMEFDNLYLDMNGIIHPCFHPQDQDDLDDHLRPVTYEDVFNNVFEYIDRLFNIVRPRKLLYMAIDGVAPRAKMNQQRVRRFRTANDSEIAEKEEERLRREFQMAGKEVLPKEESEVSDSNVITPGTLFMHQLSKELQRYIHVRMHNDPGWKTIQVILSDANVPGEGEHKIMSYIRLQRTCPGYNPNTRHCLYGLDADLIMLALATHEIHFSILREDVLARVLKPVCVSAIEFSQEEAKTSLVKQYDSTHALIESSQGGNCLMHNIVNRTKALVKKPHQLLHVWILREYLEIDLKITNLPDKFEVDFERIIDDFIFLCFFSGNDFLPHMPSLEIHEGAIDLLMHVYKEEFKSLGGYLVDMQRVDDMKGGYIKLKRVEKFILCVGTYEEKIFQKRSAIRERKLRRILAESAEEKDNEEDLYIETNKHPNNHAQRRGSEENSIASADSFEILQNTKELKEKLKDYTRKMSDVFKTGISTDKVRLGAVGWKERFYKEKFSAESPVDMESTRKIVVEKYMEGLCWVLLYYFSGVASWNWYYPFYYGPFASDFKGLSQTKVKFQKGSPFKPFDQLMGVLPSKSAHALPKPYQLLMTDEHSDISDFYCTDFEVDTDGKRYHWQGICKLSFVDETRLLAQTKKLENELNEEEASRNAESIDQLFMTSSSVLGSSIKSLHKERALMNQKDVIGIDTYLSGGINGSVSLQLDAKNRVDSDGLAKDSDVLCVLYQPPPFRLHMPRLLEGVVVPEKTISEPDIMETQLWHEFNGSWPGNRPQTDRKYSSTESSEVVIKGSGTRWNAAGRGKISPHLHVKSESARELSGRSRWGNNCVYNPSENWKPVGYGRGDPRGIENLSISDSAQKFTSYERPHQGDNSWVRQPNGRSQPANSNTCSNQRWGDSPALPSYHGSSSIQADLNRRQSSSSEKASIANQQRYYNQTGGVGGNTSTWANHNAWSNQRWRDSPALPSYHDSSSIQADLNRRQSSSSENTSIAYQQPYFGQAGGVNSSTSTWANHNAWSNQRWRDSPAFPSYNVSSSIQADPNRRQSSSSENTSIANQQPYFSQAGGVNSGTSTWANHNAWGNQRWRDSPALPSYNVSSSIQANPNRRQTSSSENASIANQQRYYNQAGGAGSSTSSLARGRGRFASKNRFEPLEETASSRYT